MNREYQCNKCGVRSWHEEVTPQEHICSVCHGVLQRTGRFSSPSLIQPSEGRSHSRSTKYTIDVETIVTTYRVHLDAQTLEDILRPFDLTKEA